VTVEASDPIRAGYAVATERFRSALASGIPIVRRDYSIAGRRIRLQIVGPRLAEGFSSPWTHLHDRSAARGRSELAIDLWHESETGIGPPAPAPGVDPLSRFPYRASSDDRVVAMRQPETSVWLDRGTRHLVGAVGDVDRRALYETSRPLETPLLVWLRDEGIALVHASFVAHENRGALILGRSGSGKSTLAAQCTCAGFDFLGDDKIAFVRRGDDFVGYSLNSSLHLDLEAMGRVPSLAGHAIAPSSPIDDKFRIPLERLHASRLKPCAPIRALVVPLLEGKASAGATAPASKKAALLALSLSTLLSLPIAQNRSLDQLAELVEAVPAYRFDLSPAQDAPARLAALLEAS
jgi:hypothetical protein